MTVHGYESLGHLTDVTSVFSTVNQKLPNFMRHTKIESYAGIIKSVCFPILTSTRIPDLLDALVEVEKYRVSVLSHAHLATSFMGINASNIKLEHEEKELLDMQVEQAGETHSLYVTIVLRFCLINIRDAWFAPNKASKLDALISLNRFFPDSNPHVKRRQAHMFHATLDGKDKERVYKTGEEAWDFLRASAEFAQELLGEQHDASWTLYDIMASDEFALQFPQPVNVDKLITATVAYLDQVSRLAHIVETKLIPSVAV